MFGPLPKREISLIGSRFINIIVLNVRLFFNGLHSHEPSEPSEASSDWQCFYSHWPFINIISIIKNWIIQFMVYQQSYHALQVWQAYVQFLEAFLFFLYFYCL